ncbi:MAG: pilus assembly protein [Sphingomonadales bacterium]|nr:pilus assembly protein [Sphingomonadales bacterium]MDE2170467.1 pilus assembly protein [Sphingomonadales bacterium]
MLKGGLGRLAKCRSGVAVVEFAFAMPLLFTMYVGAFVLSDEISCSRKVTITAHSVADLTSRYASLTPAGLQSVMAASAQVMNPYSGPTTVRVSEILVTSSTSGVVVWSQSYNGSSMVTGLATNLVVTLPANMAATGTYLVLGEVTYTYQPVIGLGSNAAITLYDKTFMNPRNSNAIPLSSS